MADERQLLREAEEYLGGELDEEVLDYQDELIRRLVNALREALDSNQDRDPAREPDDAYWDDVAKTQRTFGP